MKNRKTEIAFFVLGLLTFGYLVSKFGVDHILANIQKAQWSLVYIILVWFIVYVLNALAWRFALGDYGRTIAFPYLFMVTVSGFVINYVTPVVALGGEPYRVKALASGMGTQQSLSAVVLYRMVHLLGHMLLLLTGIIVALLYLSLPLPIALLLSIAGVVVLTVIMMTISGHRYGVFERMKILFGKTRLFRPISGRLQKYESDLHIMDQLVTDAYRNKRNRYYLSVFLEYLSRACMGLEVYLILHGVGVEITIPAALFLYVAYSLIINLLFFIPLNLGAREGGLYLGLGSLALPPLLGVYLGVVMRIREFFWILLGLLFILFTGQKDEKPSPKTL